MLLGPTVDDHIVHEKQYWREYIFRTDLKDIRQLRRKQEDKRDNQGFQYLCEYFRQLGGKYEKCF